MTWLGATRRRPSAAVGELQRGELGVEPAVGEQAVVGALLDDAALIHDQDAVGGADRGEAVGDDEGGAPLHQPVEGLLHLALALGVERRGRLVEEQDRRVLEDRARDGDAAGAGRPTG